MYTSIKITSGTNSLHLPYVRKQVSFYVNYSSITYVRKLRIYENMADEQQAAAAHKTTQNATTTAPKQHATVITKLVNPVGDQPAMQTGLTKFAVELPREKSWKEPPAGAQSLILADDHHATDTEWTTVQHRTNPSQSTIKKSSNTLKEGSNKRTGHYNRQDNTDKKMDTKKRFQSMQHTSHR